MSISTAYRFDSILYSPVSLHSAFWHLALLNRAIWWSGRPQSQQVCIILAPTFQNRMICNLSTWLYCKTAVHLPWTMPTYMYWHVYESFKVHLYIYISLYVHFYVIVFILFLPYITISITSFDIAFSILSHGAVADPVFLVFWSSNSSFDLSIHGIPSHTQPTLSRPILS